MEFTKTNQHSEVKSNYSAENTEFLYEVEVIEINSSITRVVLNVHRKQAEGQPVFEGHIAAVNGQKTMSFPQDVDVIPHIQTFETFLDSLMV